MQLFSVRVKIAFNINLSTGKRQVTSARPGEGWTQQGKLQICITRLFCVSRGKGLVIQGSMTVRVFKAINYNWSKHWRSNCTAQILYLNTPELWESSALAANFATGAWLYEMHQRPFALCPSTAIKVYQLGWTVQLCLCQMHHYPTASEDSSWAPTIGNAAFGAGILAFSPHCCMKHQTTTAAERRQPWKKIQRGYRSVTIHMKVLSRHIKPWLISLANHNLHWQRSHALRSANHLTLVIEWTENFDAKELAEIQWEENYHAGSCLSIFWYWSTLSMLATGTVFIFTFTTQIAKAQTPP